MKAADRLKLVMEELVIAKEALREWEQQAGRWKVGFEQMRGQIISFEKSANSLHRANPDAWEAHFSKRAKRQRRRNET